MKNTIFSGKEFKMSANKFKETNVAYKNSVLFEIKNNEESMGRVILSEPIKNKFIKNGEGEIEMVNMVINPDYKNEGIDVLLFDVIMDYVTSLDKVLMIFDFAKNYSEGFFERRGFKFEPVVYHQTTYVLGKNYGYNLENIEKEVHEFLTNEKKTEEDISNELKLAYVEIIAEMNTRLIEAGESPMVSFDFQGTEVCDPFVDETTGELVDPIKYYGKDFIESAFWNPLNIDLEKEDEFKFEIDIEQAIDELMAEGGLLDVLETIFKETIE